MLVEVLGSFGAGKTSLTELLNQELGFNTYIEDPEKVPILKEFYKYGEESRKHLSFSVQVAWLSERFGQLKKAVKDDKAVIDGSLIADSVVYKVIKDRGETIDAEYDIYLKLLATMMNDQALSPHGPYPDLFIYLDIDPNHEVDNIFKRGREMETQDKALVDYYHSINKGFKDWYAGFSQAPVLRIDMEKYDFVNNEEDRKEVIKMISDRLEALGAK